jgi:hypothetical protein
MDTQFSWILAGIIFCLVFGIAGRLCAIAGLVVLGFHPVTLVPDSISFILIIMFTNLLFLGTGTLSLWPVEDRLIYHRIGDPR